MAVDWPTAAIILGVIGSIIVAIIKFVPDPKGNGGAAHVRMQHLEKRQDKLEDKIEVLGQAMTDFLRGQLHD